jgi:hypothetical protein
MNLLLGLGCLLTAYIIYRFSLKGEKYSTKRNNWKGMTGSNYIGLWGSVILFTIIGVFLILNSLPTHIN